MRFRGLILLFCLLATPLWAAMPGVYVKEVKAPVDTIYKQLYAELEANRLWVVFEADMGSNMARFKDKWGADYNRSGLEAIRSMVMCNVWYANQVSGADPDALAFCPFSVTLTHKDGVTRVLFKRPSVATEGSPAQAVILEVEGLVIDAIEKATAQ